MAHNDTWTSTLSNLCRHVESGWGPCKYNEKSAYNCACRFTNHEEDIALHRRNMIIEDSNHY